VSHVGIALGVSERRACKVLGQSRSSQRYRALKAVKDKAIRERLRALAKRRPRYGYRRMWALLGREGWQVNRKRVQRLWREEGLRIQVRQRERLRPASGGTEESRLELRLPDGPDGGRSPAEAAADPGRVHA